MWFVIFRPISVFVNVIYEGVIFLQLYISISLAFPGKSDDAIVINYCILYAKQYIYLEKLRENKNQNTLNIDFLSYLSQLKYILKIEKKHMYSQ